MSEIVSLDALDKYDLWEPSDSAKWRELMQDAEMRSTCSHCGETQLGPAREVKEWFRQHALEAHNIVVTGGQLGKRKMSRVAWEPLTVEQKHQAYLARESVNPELPYEDELAAKRARGQQAVKWTRESMIALRDSYIREHGSKPSCKRWQGRPSWYSVKRVFGSWSNYMEAQ